MGNRWDVTVSLPADNSTTSTGGKCTNSWTGVLRTIDQSYPQCQPMPGMILRIEVAKQIGPAKRTSVRTAPVRSARLRRPAARKRKSSR